VAAAAALGWSAAAAEEAAAAAAEGAEAAAAAAAGDTRTHSRWPDIRGQIKLDGLACRAELGCRVGSMRAALQTCMNLMSILSRRRRAEFVCRQVRGGGRGVCGAGRHVLYGTAAPATTARVTLSTAERFAPLPLLFCLWV